MKIGFAQRFLLAIAFVIFCVVGFGSWLVGAFPWWVPFAAAGTVPVIIGVAMWIIDPGVFDG